MREIMEEYGETILAFVAFSAMLGLFFFFLQGEIWPFIQAFIIRSC